MQHRRAQFVVLLSDFLLVLKLLEPRRRAAEQQRCDDHMFSNNRYIISKVCHKWIDWSMYSWLLAFYSEGNWCTYIHQASYPDLFSPLTSILGTRLTITMEFMNMLSVWPILALTDWKNWEVHDLITRTHMRKVRLSNQFCSSVCPSSVQWRNRNLTT